MLPLMRWCISLKPADIFPPLTGRYSPFLAPADTSSLKRQIYFLPYVGIAISFLMEYTSITALFLSFSGTSEAEYGRIDPGCKAVRLIGPGGRNS